MERSIVGDVPHVAHCQRAQRGRSAYYIANVSFAEQNA